MSLMASKLLKNPAATDKRKVLMGMFEVKKKILSDEMYEKSVAQTVCYMCSALAFSRWGMLRNFSPLVALLITPTSLYRLTLSKPDNLATGLYLSVENTTNPVMMEWVLSEYITHYAQEYTQVIPANIISPESVQPFDWAPLNFDGSRWVPITTKYNLGFLFRTTSDEVMRLIQSYHLETSISQLPSGMPLVVKYVGILLESDYDIGISSIQRILASGQSAVVHPYIDIVGTVTQPLIVMKDAGEPLSKLLHTPCFRARWAQSPALRSAFLQQVGISALNLVANVNLCHNDIRPPNIAVSCDSFCLIDFDMCRNKVSSSVNSAFVPGLRSLQNLGRAQMMCFSVAQIVLTVFLLSSHTTFTLEQVTEAVSIWKKTRVNSKVDNEFEDWVQGRGGSLLEFVTAVRGSVAWPSSLAADSKGYCQDVLESLLR